MTAEQILNFAEEHANDTNLFRDIKEELERYKLDLAIRLENNLDCKKLNKQYKDVCEKIRMINLMQRQRLELFYQSGI